MFATRLVLLLTVARGAEAACPPDKELEEQKLEFVQNARAGKLEQMRSQVEGLFAECKVDVAGMVDTSQQTALHAAAFHGDAETVRWLCEDLGLDPNHRSEYGMLPLHMAARFGHVEAMRVLVRCGADATITNDFDDTTRSWAVTHKHDAFVRALDALVPPTEAAGDAGLLGEEKKPEVKDEV